MKYDQIAEIAPRLREYGFTHVQFPPIQNTRVLTELDSDILTKHLKQCEKQIEEFYALCEKAREKAYMYPPHTFDYLLRRQSHTVNQPIVREMYRAVLDGTEPTALLEYVYNHELYSDYVTTGTYPYPKELIRSAELVLKIRTPPQTEFQPEELDFVCQQYNILQANVATLRSNAPESLVLALKNLGKRHAQLLRIKGQHQNYENAMQELRTLVATTTTLRASGHVPILQAALVKRYPFQKERVKQWLDIMILCEYLLYPPWWLIYQPTKLEIGDTCLGSKEAILGAISACRAQGLEVIADVVINNLAAVAGEKKVWRPFLENATPASETLADIVPSEAYDAAPVQAIRRLLLASFGTEDLSLLTVPHECGEKQDPTHCWMSGALPQLNQRSPVVQISLQKFIESLKSVGISGVRIDAAAHLPPHVCEKVTRSFEGLSYIEYVGNAPHQYESVARLEDFAIGEDLYLRVFSSDAHTERLKNYEGLRLSRLCALDSVVMIVNHDHITGSIPSKVFSELPSQVTYELSVAYLIQRIYGNVLVMPHDIEFPAVRKALELRQHMRTAGIVREYVRTNGAQILIEKFDDKNMCRYIAAVNLSQEPMHTDYGTVQPLSFDWFALRSAERNLTPKYEYNDVRNANSLWNPWLRKYCYPRTKKSATRKCQPMPIATI